MNLTEQQEAAILKLHNRGVSQNAISKELQIPKPYVNAIINTSRRNLNGLDFSIPKSGLPVTQKLELISPPSGTSAEMYYTKKALEDAQDRNKELKNELAQKILEYETLRKEHNLLLIDHSTIQEKHNLDLERKDIQNASNQKSGLNGLFETVTAPLLKNEKLLEKIVEVAAAKYIGQSNQPSIEVAGTGHPQIADPEVKQMVQDITMGLSGFDKEKLKQLHTLISIFLAPQFPNMLSTTYGEVTQYIQKLQNPPAAE